MLELNLVAVKCRSVVEQNLTAKIACQLTSIADIYGDISLKRICLKYLRYHYDTARFLTEFDELDEKSKFEIKKAHEKMINVEQKKMKRKILKQNK